MANIYFIADSLPLGGVTSYLKTIASALAGRGHRVTILIHEGEDRSEEPWPAGVHFEKIPVGPFDTRAAVSRRVRKHLLAAGAEWVFLNNCYFADSSMLRGTQMQGVYVAHSNMEEEVARFHKEGLYCRHIVGPTPGVAARFARAFPDYHVRFIAHGTPVPKERVMKSASPFEVLYLGRFSPEKGVDLLPRILAPLLNKYADARCTILGNGVGREAYADSVRRELRTAVPDEDRLRLRGSVSRAELDNLLRAAHILLLPSREEAFGLAAIEGAAWGAVPVVTCIAGVTDRIFEDGVDAVLPPQDDAGAFAAALVKLYENPPLRDKMAEAAHRGVQVRFSVEAMAVNYEALMAHPLPPAAPKPDRVQQAYDVYRHVLFLRARKALRRG